MEHCPVKVSLFRARCAIVGMDLKKSDCFESIPQSFASHPIDSVRFALASPDAIGNGSRLQRRSGIPLRPILRRRMMRNLFIGNLSFQTTESDLTALFQPYGEIARVQVMTDRDTGRSRGFAFVEMTNDEDAAKAITELNGKEVDGRALNVNEARPKPERTGSRGGGGYGGSGGGRQKRESRG